MLTKMSPASRYRVFLTMLGILDLVFILVATAKYGAGVSSDAARNLSTADSLVAGKGFVDMLGGPLLLWPPLYPIVLAGIGILTSASTFRAAWYLNAILYSVNTWLSGWWLYGVFRNRPWYAVAGALVIASSRSLLRIHANVASEPLFQTLLLLFLAAATAYLRSGKRAVLWGLCATAGLAALQRYLGVVLLGASLLVIWRREGRNFPAVGAAPWLLSAAPFLAWIGLHNMPISGSPFGPRQLGEMLPLQNISLSLTKILWWFVPRWGPLDWLILRPWLVLVAVTVVLLIMNKKTDWRNWIAAIADPTVWPAVVVGVVYFFLVAFTVVTADHLDLTSDRYYVVLLPVVVVVLLITLDRLFLHHVGARGGAPSHVLVILFALWLVYPGYAMTSYLQEARERGEPTNYNIANSAQFREMSVVRAAEPILSRDPQAVVYSNYLNIVWFIFGHPVRALPYEDAGLSREQRLAALPLNYPDWPPAAGYIIWFTPNQYHHIVAPDELTSIADLELLYRDPTGMIFYVHSRGG